jgi:hypothetical protein
MARGGSRAYPHEMAVKFPKAIEPIYSLKEALALVAADPDRAYVNVRDGEPPMPAPWHQGMQLDGGLMYLHPARNRRKLQRLASA